MRNLLQAKCRENWCRGRDLCWYPIPGGRKSRCGKAVVAGDGCEPPSLTSYQAAPPRDNPFHFGAASRSAAPVFEPIMGRAVDLDEFADTLAPIPRLVNGGQGSAAVEPKAVLDHPFTQPLARNPAIAQLAQLFGIAPTRQLLTNLNTAR